MTFSNYKFLVASLAVISATSLQTAQASSAYSATATYNFTITATNTNLNSNDLSNLSIGSTIDDFGYIINPTLNLSPVFTSSSSSSSSNLNDFTSFNTSYSQTFHSEDSISSGSSSSEYLGTYIQTFQNNSFNAADVFEITIDYTYDLTTSVSGENANTDLYFTMSNEFFDLDVTDYASSSIAGNSSTSPGLVPGTFSFTLENGEYDAIYADSTLTGALEAVAPVPVPAAVWLFSSALIALSGMRKLKLS